ncbi:MAG: BamA/TamA family outer membrane protein [Pseudomonadales bacterium]|nr:BamA/TamA family outer membrane protein [Pseudomonadales bacterium]
MVVISLFHSFLALAKPAAGVKSSTLREETGDQLHETLIFPYVLSTEGMGLVVGVGGMRKGFHQPQMITGATAFAGEESKGLVLGVWDYKVPNSEHIYLSSMGMLGDFPRNRAYTSGQLSIPANTIRPGSNESSSDQFIEAEGVSNWWEIQMEYSLPIGATVDKGMIDYRLQRGLLVSEPSGGLEWNPLKSGSSIVLFRQFNRYLSFESEGQMLDAEVHAFELGFLYDNTDFPVNPSFGSSQYISVSIDPGKWGESTSWSFIEAEASKYISFGATDWARQRILALNAWLAYSPSWQLETDDNDDSRVKDSAPFMEGATLGGFFRMRGFDQNRFHDKAAIYGSVEYRYTLEYNPLEGVQWLQFLNMDWAQLVVFAEAGRVAPEFSSHIFSDIKTDMGLAIRALMAGSIIRFDVAGSEEGISAWVMVGHPF